MTREEVIKEAWGEYFEQIPKNWMNENGGVYAAFIEREAIWLLDVIKLEKVSPIEYRPTKIINLESNNGWIKIESEDDLPKDLGTHWFIPCNKIEEAFIGIADLAKGEVWFLDSSRTNKFIDKPNAWLTKQITHYAPIEKKNPPIF